MRQGLFRSVSQWMLTSFEGKKFEQMAKKKLMSHRHTTVSDLDIYYGYFVLCEFHLFFSFYSSYVNPSEWVNLQM